MDEDKIKEIMENPTASNQGEVKMLLYKFFFFNYVFQVTGPDLMESLMSGQPEDPLKHFGRDFPPIMKPHEMNAEQRE